MRLTAMSIAAALLVGAAPAAAAEPVVPQYETQTTFFHCPADVPVGNVSGVPEQAIPTWNSTAPTSSTGCATGDSSLTGPTPNRHDAVWSGPAVGNLRSMKVRLNMTEYPRFAPLEPAQALTVGFELVVDGVSLVNSTRIAAVKTTSTPGLLMAEFTIDGLPFGVEDGVGVIERDVTLMVNGGAPLVVWTFDSTHSPAGVTFNP